MKMMKNSQHKISRLSDVINQAVAGPHVKVLEAKNSISPKGELLLYGVIGDWWDGMDALTIVRELEQLPGNEIVVRIQSPGGNVTEGLAMYNRLKQSPKKIIVYIDGIAASMGAGVAMAGDVVYIPSNAMMMLHKPSLDGVGGNENDLRDLADALAKFEQSYAQIHADKTGKSVDEIKSLIADGKNHFFVGQEAVDYGLADEVIQSVSLDATACLKFNDMGIPQKITASLFKQPAAAAAQTQEENDMIKIKAMKGGWHFVPAINAALNGSFAKIEDAVAALKTKIPAANLQSILEGTAECDNDTLKALGAEFGIDVVVTIDSATALQTAATNVVAQVVSPLEAVAHERNRVRDIRAVAAQASVDEATLNGWIDSGTSVADARAQALNIVAQRDTSAAPQITHVRTTGSVNRDGMRSAMANALLNRIAPDQHKLSDNGRDFRGMNIMGMVSASLEYAGFTVRGKTNTELLAMAMHTTSDFPLILQDVANITLRASYVQAPRTFAKIATQTSANDFRAKHSVSVGTGSDLSKVNQSGEFESGTVSEGGESYKLDTYGKIFNFSRQLLLNDDIGALTSFMAQVGSLAGRKENQIVWALVKANPNMRDGAAVFGTGASRKNQFAGTAINETTLSAGRKAMRQMKGLDGEPISVSPRYLVVNSERETEAQKQIIVVQPSKADDVNVFSNSMELIVEPLLDGETNNPWYMFADRLAVPCLEYCYLNGEAGPYIETKWGFEVDGMSLKVRHDFGAGWVDYRGAVKCTGA